MGARPFDPGDIVFLERQIPGIPYPSGYWVVLSLTDLRATISLVSHDEQGLYGIDNPYTILREDLDAFTYTGKRARLKK